MNTDIAARGTGGVRGVTCAVCCHNSADRLPETLRHLAVQRVPPEINWEVLVVDNASSDGTADVARAEWRGPPEQLRVVEESKPGLCHARIRALEAARYDVLSFIDDDNHVADDWVAQAYSIMVAHPEVGILNGKNLARPEIEPPAWFDEVRRYWAVEGEPRQGGDITGIDCLPSGAGLTLRKAALKELVDDGFRFTLTGRQGKGMAAGEDHELVMAMMFRGWRAWHEPSMVLHHFLPAERLTWEYARRLLHGVGEASAKMDAYLIPWMIWEGIPVNRRQRHWLWRAVATMRDWALLAIGARSASRKLLAERQAGRLLALLRMRGDYGRRQREVETAGWRSQCEGDDHG